MLAHVGWLLRLLRATQGSPVMSNQAPLNGDAKYKHLELISAVIGRMANNSFLFKGWSITIATGLAAFAAVDRRRGLLLIALITEVLFWVLDGYYLWLERRFRDLYDKVARRSNDQIDFSMAIDRKDIFRRWLRTCFRLHLVLFYGGMITAETVAILLMKVTVKA